MPTSQKLQISSRKQPRQARSNELVAAILEAALQVLSKEGAHRFTTVRVAEKAGVSVGSLYQYFPNKAAILFRLQSDEWNQTSNLLESILTRPDKPPLARLRAAVHAFIRSECDEAALRIALHDAAPLYRHAPEAHEAHASSAHIIDKFLEEALPRSTRRNRQTAGLLIKTTLSATAKQFSETPRTPAEIRSFSNAMADMLCGYLTNRQA